MTPRRGRSLLCHRCCHLPRRRRLIPDRLLFCLLSAGAVSPSSRLSVRVCCLSPLVVFSARPRIASEVHGKSTETTEKHCKTYPYERVGRASDFAVLFRHRSFQITNLLIQELFWPGQRRRRRLPPPPPHFLLRRRHPRLLHPRHRHPHLQERDQALLQDPHLYPPRRLPPHLARRLRLRPHRSRPYPVYLPPQNLQIPAFAAPVMVVYLETPSLTRPG